MLLRAIVVVSLINWSFILINKRKGQIVPGWLVRAVEKKSQHLITFGADVEICRGSKKVKVISEGSVFNVSNKRYVLGKKNKRIVKGFVFCEISVCGLSNHKAVVIR